MASICQRWRLWILPVLTCLYALLIIIIVPILLTNSIRNGIKKQDQGALVGGAFVLLALPIAFYEIIQHMIYFTQPKLQKYIIRILWMVPIYAVNAWLGLVYPESTIYVDSLRECYEAYVIYNFMMYLFAYLNADQQLEHRLEISPQVHHMFPLCCLLQWEMGHEFVHMCKHGILQYTAVRPISTLISVICALNGVYGEGEFRGDVAFPYMIALNNLSQFVAMYCLVLFYRANAEALQPMKPIGKFLCIKAVVFFSFFQGVLIAMLVYCNVISSIFDTDNTKDIRQISSKLQNFLICIEMFMAAVAHHYSFSYKPYVNLAQSQAWWDAFRAMWDVSDVHNDIKEHLGVVGSSLSRRIRGRSVYQEPCGNANERTSLLPETQTSRSAPSSTLSGYHSGESANNSGSSECILACDEFSPEPQNNHNSINPNSINTTFKVILTILSPRFDAISSLDTLKQNLKFLKIMEVKSGTESLDQNGKSKNNGEDHEEYQYLRLIDKIIKTGIKKSDRTGTGTFTIAGPQMRFNLRNGIFPLLTTKRVFWRGVVEELLWFVRGSTNAKELSEKGVKIWDPNSSREFLDSCGFTDREEGDLGPVYGFQWRHFGATYTNMHADYTGQGKKQNSKLISLFENPGEFIINMGDCHVYSNHVSALEEQLKRVPKSFPKLKITREVKDIDSFTPEDFQLEGYDPHGKISMPMAV
ncbi:transmembrane protein 184C-like [Belonocnema kinseyi]|uniref:transmembrane protein 184C-like n=1 Tax=Belonocnema kinseyi TaxID=2817044 RepID=UPI00143DE2F2|nr:transmembrane protein 184C-like [Belonocnema kinseyi]